MNPQAPKNINNGRSMDVVPGGRSNGDSTPPPIGRSPQLMPNTVAPADGITQATESPEMSQVAPSKSGRLSPKMIVIIILVVILILGALLVGLLYVRSQNNNDNDDQPVATSPVDNDNNGRVTTEEIDETLAEIDKTLNTLDDSGDFTPNDLSDNTLGL